MTASSFDQKSMINQAQNIWTMLDDMAANDPSSYKKFIEKHIKEGKEEMAPPKPHMCIRTVIKAPQKETLYVNFFSWHRIPVPKTPDDPVPAMGSCIEKEKDDKGVHAISSVAFNPKVLEEFGREAKNLADQDTLVNLALDYIDDLNKIKCSRSYIILPKDNLYKGSLTKLQKSFTKKTSDNDKKLNEDFDEMLKTFGPLGRSSNSKGSLLEQLATIAVEDDTPPTSSPEKEPQIILPDAIKTKPGLIEEIGGDDKGGIETPNYEIEKSWNDKNHAMCCVKIFLPKVTSVSECELDISEDDLSLTVPEKYTLKLKLVDPIDEDKSKAKFIKKSHCLMVTMPIIKK
ncbi:hypothetical protein SNE40_015970 [Patella caerulea]|uniref:CS domain-containing protein n=1 Tax=Patella caerulea TaxID=87958 RepID=A0AAN8PCB3_PATCE